MSVIFARERLTSGLLEEILPLAAAHFNEIGTFPDMKPAIKLDYYHLAQDKDMLRIFTARNGDLVGYAVFMVAPHPHYQNSLQATQDLIYLDPAARQGASGRDFIEWCDEHLKAEGIQVVYHFSSFKRDIGSLLAVIGYQPIQQMWARRLTHG